MYPDYDSGRLEVRFVCDGLQILRGKYHGGLDDRGGEFQADAGAEGLLVVQHDFAAGFLDDAVADAEAEASTFAHRLGGEERIERAVQVAEAGAGIVEADENAIALARGGNGNGALRAFFHRVNRIVQNIQQYLLQLVLADGNARKLRLDVQLHANAELADVEL